MTARRVLVPREWNAAVYHRVSEPQLAWGRKVLDRLNLAGDETVLDAGCGSGRLTAELAERLPRGRVVAVDLSRAMVAQAGRLLAPRFDGRVAVVGADLVALPIAAVCDVAFSTATFHWIQDHDRLFAQLRAALRSGGRLEAQCGGAGNLERVHEHAEALAARPDFAPSFAGWREPWNFPTAEDAALRLDRAGFVGVETWLEEAPTPFASAEDFATFVTVVVLRPHLARLPAGPLAERFVAEMVASAADDDPPLTLDYWRLNLRARKP